MIIKQPANSRVSGFTLIELLIVVAIISILTAIAIPNFLEAQTRAKSARAMADMRSLGVAVEAYSVDYNTYPRGRLPNPSSGPADIPNIIPLSQRIVCLTTPVAYISMLPMDAFPATAGSYGLEPIYIDTYDYYDAESDKDEDGAGLGTPPKGINSTRFCMWRLASAGPDLYQSYGIIRTELPTVKPDPRDLGGVEYDPTNGTVSWGDITRCGPKYQ